MYFKPLSWILALSTLTMVSQREAGGSEPQQLVFATYAGVQAELVNTVLLTRSIRAFAGSLSQAAVWVYLPPELLEQESTLVAELTALDVSLKTSTPPADATWYYYTAKVFAAAAAEEAAAGNSAILAWLDEDTILLHEPGEFLLSPEKSFGYRPVMHRNICPRYEEPLDDFWEHVYQLMSVDEAALFPMTTPAFGDRVRPYFNAGCLVVRPERKLLRKWAEQWGLLYNDQRLRGMSEEDQRKRIFLHQVALIGAVLNTIEQGEMLEFSDQVNYPLFFQKMFGAEHPFDDVSEVVSLRHESFYRNGSPAWLDLLQGPRDRIDWIRENLPGKNE
jgi:hypothetical protein